MHRVLAQSRTRRTVLLAIATFLSAAVAASAQTAESLRVVPLVRDDHVLVSFDLQDGFTDDVRAAIRSGLKTTFTYSVDLRLDVPGWVDRTISTSNVSIAVEYDNLTRRYSITRVIDGHIDESRVSEDERLARAYLTSAVKLPLFRTGMLEPNREYYVQVRATARPSNGSILWPFGNATSAQTKFTFLR